MRTTIMLVALKVEQQLESQDALLIDISIIDFEILVVKQDALNDVKIITLLL